MTDVAAGGPAPQGWGRAVPALVLLCAGCAGTRPTITDAFPPARVASPWVLRGEVWSGSFAEAAGALGEDADKWRSFRPQRVWLAVYEHESKPERCLTVRCFVFGSVDEARAAFDAFAPPDAAPLQAGDAGCWTDIGVLFRWRRLVLDIFGRDASWSSEVQSAMLAAFITKRMPKGAPDDPR